MNEKQIRGIRHRQAIRTWAVKGTIEIIMKFELSDIIFNQRKVNSLHLIDNTCFCFRCESVGGCKLIDDLITTDAKLCMLIYLSI